MLYPSTNEWIRFRFNILKKKPIRVVFVTNFYHEPISRLVHPFVTFQSLQKSNGPLLRLLYQKLSHFIVINMLLNTLYLLAIFSSFFFASPTGGATAFVSTLADPSNFDCEKLTESDELPAGWEWNDVAKKINTEECFEKIAANMNLWIGDEHSRQLFKVIRTDKDIFESRHYCVLAKRIAGYALVEDLATLEMCKIDINSYPVPLLAIVFKNAGYKLTGIDYKNITWGAFPPDDIGRQLKQHLWLALVAVLHDGLDDEVNERKRLWRFFIYITNHHGIDLKESTPLTELDTQIIRLLPVAIEYIWSKSAEGGRKVYIIPTRNLYSDLRTKVASNQALSLYLHSCFLIDVETDLELHFDLVESGYALPPISDVQMTKKLFDYGNNLSSISDLTDRDLATTAREQLETLLFPPSKE